MPSLDLAVGLRIIGRGPDVRHAGDAHKLLEVARNELRPVVGDDTRLGARVQLATSLQDRFDVGLAHGFTNLPVHDGAAESVEDRAQVVEGAGDVEVGDVDVPVLVRTQRLLETSALLRRLLIPTIQQPSGAQDAVDAGRGSPRRHLRRAS